MSERVLQLNEMFQTGMMDNEPDFERVHQAITLRLMERRHVPPEIIEQVRRYPDLAEEHLTDSDRIDYARAVDAILGRIAAAEAQMHGFYAPHELPAAMLRGLDLLYPTQQDRRPTR